MTSGAVFHYTPTIGNTGEVVWAEGVDMMNARIYSGTRGQLTNGCPAGQGHTSPSVNACGDVTFTNQENSGGSVAYRLGNNSPCVADPRRTAQAPCWLAHSR